MAEWLPELTAANMDFVGFFHNPTRFLVGPAVFDPGLVGPRTNLESQGAIARPWPTVYAIPCRGVGNLGLFQLGPTPYVFNNAFAGNRTGPNIMIGGLAKAPFGG